MKVHNQITRGDLSSAVSRALGDSRHEGGVERYSETLGVLMDMWRQPEWAYLRAERLCAGFGTEAADVANLSNVQLINPAGSGTLAVVEAITVRAPLIGGFTLDETTVAMTTLVTGQTSVRDGRWRSALTVCQVRRGVTAAAAGTPVWFYQVQTNGDRDLPCVPWVLPPGSSIYVRGAAINLGVSGSFMWRERKAYPGELI